MTPPVDDPETLRRILAQTDALLLDFDGPICSVFSGIPAPIVADQLRAILAQGGHTTVPAHITAATDPFDILFYAATLGPDEARYVEAAFRAHEVEAVQTAQPTPGAHDLIRAWKATGRNLAIVSNNSAESVGTYLDIHRLRQQVDSISARTSADTSLLKPSAHLVTRALIALAKPAPAVTLIGDSTTDVEAAHAAGLRIVAFANRPGKAERLAKTEPAAIATNLGLVVAAVLTHREPII